MLLYSPGMSSSSSSSSMSIVLDGPMVGERLHAGHEI